VNCLLSRTTLSRAPCPPCSRPEKSSFLLGFFPLLTFLPFCGRQAVPAVFYDFVSKQSVVSVIAPPVLQKHLCFFILCFLTWESHSEEKFTLSRNCLIFSFGRLPKVFPCSSKLKWREADTLILNASSLFPPFDYRPSSPCFAGLCQFAVSPRLMERTPGGEPFLGNAVTMGRFFFPSFFLLLPPFFPFLLLCMSYGFPRYQLSDGGVPSPFVLLGSWEARPWSLPRSVCPTLGKSFLKWARLPIIEVSLSLFLVRRLSEMHLPPPPLVWCSDRKLPLLEVILGLGGAAPGIPTVFH